MWSVISHQQIQESVELSLELMSEEHLLSHDTCENNGSLSLVSLQLPKGGLDPSSLPSVHN